MPKPHRNAIAPPPGDLIGSAELARRLGVALQQVRKWVGLGMPAYARPPSGPGRPGHGFRWPEVEAWLASRERTLPRAAAAADRQPKPPAVAGPAARAGPPEPPPVEPPPLPPGQPPEAVVKRALKAGDPDHLLSLRERLRATEQVDNQRFALAVRDGASAAEVAMLHNLWLADVSALEVLERRLPAILHSQRRYVDLHAVAATLGEAMAAFTAHLDQLPDALCDELADQPSAVVRARLSEALRDARANLHRTLTRFVGPAPDAEASPQPPEASP